MLKIPQSIMHLTVSSFKHAYFGGIGNICLNYKSCYANSRFISPNTVLTPAPAVNVIAIKNETGLLHSANFYYSAQINKQSVKRIFAYLSHMFFP